MDAKIENFSIKEGLEILEVIKHYFWRPQEDKETADREIISSLTGVTSSAYGNYLLHQQEMTPVELEQDMDPIGLRSVRPIRHL